MILNIIQAVVKVVSTSSSRIDYREAIISSQLASNSLSLLITNYLMHYL